MGQTVMMVDDDEAFLEELGEVLSTNGYNSVSVSDPEKVVETAQKIRPTLIFMDLKMPGKNGFELALELRNQPALADIPVIAMSGFFQSQRIPLLALSGIRKCLTKPLNPLDVIETIEETLAKTSARFEESLGLSVGSEEVRGKQLFMGSFDTLLTEMAGDVDLATLSEMSEKLERLKGYKERMKDSLSRSVFRLRGISKGGLPR